MIVTDISKKHIAKFVDFSEKKKLMLMMKYLSFENLRSQKYIDEKENLQILFQELQTLEYLYSQSSSFAHRDIKPENILVQSRMFFVIKLADFELTKNDFIFETFCETTSYVAFEIGKRSDYITMMNI